MPTLDRRRPDAIRRFFFKAPVGIYRGPISEIMRGRCIMLLSTGRRSGQRRTTGVSFMPLDDQFIFFSGWGVRSNWY